jgi:hypothetical protein
MNMSNVLLKAMVIIAAFQCISHPLLADSDKNWELVKNKDGIKVYTRPFVGSEVDEFKGTTIINAGIESILAMFMQIEEQSKWMSQCIEARMVKRVNEYEGIMYNVTDLPWPCDDRDVVVRQYFKVDKKGRVVIDFHAVRNAEEYVPPRKRTVRMTELKGQWLLVSLDRKRTQATYTIRANPAGMIPTWMANFASRNIPYETLMSVIERVRDKRFINIGKKLRVEHAEIASEVVRGRLRANAKEIGDPTLLALLQKDQELINTILDSDSEARPIILKWIANHYKNKDGVWIKAD